MKLCLISDTHNMHDRLVIPECDILIHAGDITGKGAFGKLAAFNSWVADLLEDDVVKEDVIYIAGNHDLTLDDVSDTRVQAESIFTAGQYLNKTMAYIGPADSQLCVYGLPEQLKFCNWAFNTDEAGLAKHLENIPEDVDILVTHGPPHGVLDDNHSGTNCGSVSMYNWIKQYQPKLVVCGHIHESRGIALIDNTLVVNASICTGDYSPTNQPIILEL